LPGLDGSAALAQRFLMVKPAGARVLALSLPREPCASYGALAQTLAPQLPDGPLVLIGNSFSGPLALALARLRPPLGLILAATFVSPPAPRWLGRPPWSLFSKLRPSALGASLLLTGGDIELAEQVTLAVGWLSPAVIESRVRLVLEADATDDLAACPCPLLYLRASRDAVIPDAEPERIRRVRPDIEVQLLEAPHLVLQASPRWSWHHIGRFAARCT
jgi:pimeloyl-[acyl-carrier protein] methyl ester esterase